MTALNILAYVADVAILLTYALMARKPDCAVFFHLANAVGCLPLLAVEIIAHLWQPLVLTAAFGLIGLFGVVREFAPLHDERPVP